MHKIILFLIPFISIIANTSQDTTKTNISPWHNKMSLGFNISQIAFSEWAKGGENAITWTALTEFESIYKSDTWTLKNDFKIAYGRTKLGKEEFKTNNNEINIDNVLSYNIGFLVDLFFSNSLRTQVTTGYDYKKKPKITIVDFFDPGYLTQSFGFTYDKLEFGRTRFGIALQETFTHNHNQYTDDKETDKIEKFKFETGIESVTNAEINLDTNIKLKSKLRLFSSFENLDVWDVNWSNNFSSKINSFLQVSLDFVLIYEKAQSVKTQIKEAFQLGIIYTII